MQVDVYKHTKEVETIEIDKMPLTASEVSTMKGCSLPAVYTKISKGELTVTVNGLVVIDKKLKDWCNS